jgi:hypothetical protein
MAVSFYMDVHVPYPITAQLRRRSVDVLTAQDDGRTEAPDAELLSRATELGRVIFTQDVLFRVLAENCQRMGKEFSGLLFGPQIDATIGQYVTDLELVAKASAPTEWQNVIEFLPFKRNR